MPYIEDSCYKYICSKNVKYETLLNRRKRTDFSKRLVHIIGLTAVQFGKIEELKTHQNEEKP